MHSGDRQWYSILMRTSFLSLTVILFILSFGTEAHAETNAANLLTENLSFGSKSAQVVLLQQILNRDIDTRIASTGPGSPGNESNYFGSLTKAAIARFQEKYAGEVLTPASLTRGNGYVGSYTRAKLNALSGVTLGISTVSSTSSPLTSPAIPPLSVATPQNPNQKNIDLYIGAMKKAGLKQGMTPDTLSLIEEKIRKEAATTTDFRQQFFDNQKSAYVKKISELTPKSPVLAFAEKAMSFLQDTFSIQKAHAGLGVPFGGYITYVNPVICDCPPGVVTQIFVALPNANPATSNLLLNYVNFSEAFSWYNIPEPGIGVIGTYIPAIPSCWTYVAFGCILIPSEGQITPQVGSSPVP
jgi:hypothetical protein